MSTVRRYNKYAINAAVADFGVRIDHEAAKRGGYVDHPHNDYVGVTFDAPEPDAEQTAYDLAQHQHRSVGDWIEDHANRIVWPLVGAFVALVWVGAVGVVEGWW